MTARLLWALAATLLTTFGAQADPADSVPSRLGFGSKGYVWNKMTAEQVAAMKLTGDAASGQQAFRGCQGCHKPDGAGRVDGSYPRLTGQHAVVIVKQVTDTRAGIRINPKMSPFASEHALSLQELADIAVYLSGVTSLAENGMGDEKDARRGAKRYAQLRCDRCHGKAGEGNAAKIYPVVAAQHYNYLLREMEHVQAGTRGNSHPEMVKGLRGVSPADLAALASFMSRLPDHRERAR